MPDLPPELPGDEARARREQRAREIHEREHPSPAGGQGPPAGWYVDPTNGDKERWWDGVRWGEQVRNPGEGEAQAPQPPPPQTPPPAPPAPTQPSAPQPPLEDRSDKGPTRLNEVPAPEGGTGWHSDPLGSGNERYFDGEGWSNQVRSRPEPARTAGGKRSPSFMDRIREAPTWLKIVVPVVVVIFVIGAIASGNKSSDNSHSSGRSTSAAESAQAPQSQEEARERREEKQEEVSEKKEEKRDEESELKEDAASVDKNSRTYIEAVRRCQEFVGILALDIKKEASNTFELAEEATGARDVCDSVRSELLTMDTDHFDDQAERAWYGVDRLKSGLNALLAFVDKPQPTKLIEARDKIKEGSVASELGVREINGRRHVYGLPPVR